VPRTDGSELDLQRNRTFFVALPQRGEMFMALATISLLKAP
jgi:hypothetical protein